MKQTIIILILSAFFHTIQAQSFESATEAVKNMRIGWNLGNSLDSNSGDINNLWIEQWTDGSPMQYEIAWGQPVTRPELMEMFRKAGFGTIRIPVTWYPHIDSQGNIDKVWMARVREVVDYVINQGMYCVLNVHHDTGAANTHWLRASSKVYQNTRQKFENLWTNIAKEFKDYDEKLIFEGYNEMLDTLDSWCYASFNAQGKYNSSIANDAYSAINSYAQSFVNAVRATGGNNAERNLIINTYGGCSGEGTWQPYLSEPLKYLELPDDSAEGHLITQVHVYPTLDTEEYKIPLSQTMNSVRQCFNSIDTHLKPKGVPVIIGEWGTDDSSGDYGRNKLLTAAFAEEFVELAKQRGMATLCWMLLSGGSDRTNLVWTMPEVKDAIIDAYYGPSGYIDGIENIENNVKKHTDNTIYDLQGRNINTPQKGIYIKGGRKHIIN